MTAPPASLAPPSVGLRGRVMGAPGLPALLIGLACTALMLGWVGGDAYRETLVITTVTYALVALGIYVPYVMSGSLSMAYAAYAAIGGYAVGLISRETSLPLWTAWLVGPILSAVLAVLLGMVTRRLSGFFLAAVTLLFGLAFAAFLRDARGSPAGKAGSVSCASSTCSAGSPTPTSSWWCPRSPCAWWRSCSTGPGCPRGA
jgi:branched-chain amino acid transport system permease protein